MTQRSSGILPVLGVWMTSGAVLGVAVALGAQLTGSDGGLAVPVGMALGLAAGGVAWRVERRQSTRRPTVVDAAGQATRPPHGTLYAIPILAAVPALAALLVLTVVATESLLPAAVFGSGGFAAGWSLRQVYARHQLQRALEDLAHGEGQRAHATLSALEANWSAPRNSRATARLNLAMLALSAGEIDRAAELFDRVRKGSGGAFATAGLALTRVIQDRLDDAETLVAAAMQGDGAHFVQNQTDAVRLLIALRRDDLVAARQLGESLESPGAGELFVGLLAYTRLTAGDVPGARVLTTEPMVHALAPWRPLLPEIAMLLAAPELATAA